MANPSGEGIYHVGINGQVFTVSQSTITGAQIRALGGLSDQDMLVKEGFGADPDRLIADGEQVALGAEKTVTFYTHPPAVFG